MACTCTSSKPVAPVPSNTGSGVAPPAFTCGGAVCADDQMCEDSFKGHATDDEGRPLDQILCVPLPPACREARTCACVTAIASATHCTDHAGQVRIDDYPE
jgi:hypothetical protein